MDRQTLRAMQAPLRDRYAEDPTSAWTALHAQGDFSDDGITCTVAGYAGPVRAGLHPSTGGTGDDACSGDMLMEALAACAGVTARSVATAMGLELGSVEVHADSHFDARGTLGIDRSVPVGVGESTVTIKVAADLDEATATRLATSTERYCVVGQSLATPPTVVVLPGQG
jgi:uncharacterized OsmC-like protein